VDLGVLTLEIVQFQSENIHLSLLSTAAEASKFTSTSTGWPPVPNNSKMSYDITSKTLQLPASAVNMTLPAFATCARRALSSKPAVARLDRQTEGPSPVS